MTDAKDFWDYVDALIAGSRLVIDRPKGSHHPRYSAIVHPLDYGYLEGTASMDGGGIDVWRGSGDPRQVAGVICTVDMLKRDSEVKVILGCSDEEVQTILRFLNEGYMRALLFRRPA